MKTIYMLVKNSAKMSFNRTGVAATPSKDRYRFDLFPRVAFRIRGKDEKDSE